MEFIQQNLMIVILVVTSGGMLIFTSFMAASQGARVSTSEATNLINREDAQILDVRDGSGFSSGHLIGAKNIPTAKFAERSVDLDKLKGKPIIVCCDTGIRSGKAAGELKKLGFDKVYSLDGGIEAWAKAGLPITKKGERK